MSENTNLAQAESDSTQPSLNIDTASLLDIDFGGEEETEQSNLSASSQDATDEVETDDTQESGEEADSEETSEEEPVEAVDDDVYVTLADGKEVPLKELKNGYLRQGDYQRKTQELANQRREYESKFSEVAQQEAAIIQQSRQLQSTLDGLAEYLSKKLPPNPEPSLAISDPAEFVRQKAIYDASMGELETILTAQRRVSQDVTKSDQLKAQKELQAEQEKLYQALPMMRDENKRQEIATIVYDYGRKLGYSDAELDAKIDHRELLTAYYAAQWLKSQEQRKAAIKKIEKAPTMPAGVRKQQIAGGNNRSAMQRLAKTGSMRDALAVDFD